MRAIYRLRRKSSLLPQAPTPRDSRQRPGGLRIWPETGVAVKAKKNPAKTEVLTGFCAEEVRVSGFLALRHACHSGQPRITNLNYALARIP